MSSIEYTVTKDDTLFQIGKHHNINWRFIGHFNNLENLNVITPGQTILIPTSTQSLIKFVDVLNIWYESRDKSDVTEVAVQLETFARTPNVPIADVFKWLDSVQLASVEGIVWEFYNAGKLTTLSWFVGEFCGEWRKHLSGDTK